MASIYNPRTRFLVVDIETPTHPNSLICDISFGIWSRSEGMIMSQGYLVQENRKVATHYKKEGIYMNYLEMGLYTISLLEEIMTDMQNAINEYQPKFATAYNSGFDFPRIRNACKAQRIACPLDSLTEFDLWRGACETLGQQKTFKRWVDANAMRTPKGNRKSGAETMYAYLTLNSNFEEEHTGLADIFIEASILERVQRQKKKLSMITGGNPWKLVQG